ncbi:uncharacterized protein LOC143287605 [Babylonia areolata]|uniref:uncharacterized protein LOC143287605 n=1 Tax=Babylonia areolata TaxID=304850 RepID=UPI003FD2A1EB
MDPADKDLLISCRPELVDNIDIGNGLLTHLLSRRVLNQRMVQSITYNKPPDRQVEELLDLLPKRGANAFKLFCESLIASDQEDVVTNILQKKNTDTETASLSSSSSVPAVSVPASPLPPETLAPAEESPCPESLPISESQPASVGGLSVQGASTSTSPSPLLTPTLHCTPPSSPLKRQPVRLSREASENEDKSGLLASPSETDSSPMKRFRPDSGGSYICIRGDKENVIKIYSPAPDEKGDHQRDRFGSRTSGTSIQPPPPPFPSLVSQTAVAQQGAGGEEVRHVMKHFILKECGEERGEEEHIRLASSLLADLPQDLMKLMSGSTSSPSKVRRLEEEYGAASDFLRERLSRSDSTDTMETRKPQNLRLDVGRKPETDPSIVTIQSASTGVPPIPVMKSSDGPVHVHVEECTRQFYNQMKDKSYRMVGMPRGQALIINVNEVLEKPPRRGTDIDRDNLKNLLEQLHFQVTIYNDQDDLTAVGMADKLRAFARKPEHTSADACVICLLSHGEEGYMFGTDGKKIPLDEVFLLFDNRHCPTLLNKPKVFFIQACRGGMLDQGVKVKLDEPDGGPPGHQHNIQQHPSMSDMLICYPTLQGYYAWRNREKGSWYIEAVVKVFMKYSKCEDVCAMLNRVNSDVSRKVSRTPQTEMDRMSQMSEYKSSLRRPYLFFFPGIGAPSLQ